MEVDLKLYKIKDWQKHFENNRSRTVEKLSWVAVPNSHDGENFTQIITAKNGAEIFAAWVLLVQVASKCQPRGTLLRGDGRPHDSASLSLKTRAPEKWFELCLKFLTENTDWLEFEDIADGCQPTVRQVSADCQAGDEGRKEGRKGREGTEYHTNARSALHLLNEKTGKHFRETDANLGIISARLRESGVDLDGVKQMIARQCDRWKGTTQEEYLRPETLFGKTKFDSYYAAKDLPVQTQESHGTKTNRRNDGCYEPDDYAAAAKRKLARQEVEWQMAESRNTTPPNAPQT